MAPLSSGPFSWDAILGVPAKQRAVWDAGGFLQLPETVFADSGLEGKCHSPGHCHYGNALSTASCQNGNTVIQLDATSLAVDGKWVKNQLDRTGLSQAELARYLKLAPPIVNKIVRGRRQIKAIEADEIRAFFGLRINATDMNDSQGGALNETKVQSSLIDANIVAPLRSEMARDIPILGTVSGGAGALQMNGEPIDWACRPPRLHGRTDVFALYVEDVSMDPAHRPGSLIFVERAKPPSVGDDVVVEIQPTNPREEQRALIKRLIGVTPTTIRLEQYNPPKTIDVPRKAIINLLRVMTLADLLGR